MPVIPNSFRLVTLFSEATPTLDHLLQVANVCIRAVSSSRTVMFADHTASFDSLVTASK